MALGNNQRYFAKQIAQPCQVALGILGIIQIGLSPRTKILLQVLQGYGRHVQINR